MLYLHIKLLSNEDDTVKDIKLKSYIEYKFGEL